MVPFSIYYLGVNGNSSPRIQISSRTGELLHRVCYKGCNSGIAPYFVTISTGNRMLWMAITD